jgi:DNA mismatch repair protein MutS2
VREAALGDAEAAAHAERSRLDAGAGDAAERERALTVRERTLDTRAREQARSYLLDARRTVEAALGQARAAVDDATAREARRMIEQAIAEAKEDRWADGRMGGSQEPRVGDRVRTTEGMVGTVRELRTGGDVVIEAGAVRIVVAPTAIASVLDNESAAPAKSHPSVHPSIRPSATVGSEVSLRGLRADEAEAALERALDSAVLDDLPYLRVIHGKGTGALRDLVQRVLKHDNRVVRFGLAPANQGGSGVTVVEFS